MRPRVMIKSAFILTALLLSTITTRESKSMYKHGLILSNASPSQPTVRSKSAMDVRRGGERGDLISADQ